MKKNGKHYGLLALSTVLIFLAGILLFHLPAGEKITEETVGNTLIEESIENIVEEKVEEPEVYTEKQVSLLMVGDVLLHTNVSDSGKREDGTYNYDHLFANVKEDIEQADLAIVNQEVILGGTKLGLSGYPSFNGAFEVGDALVDAGFDVVLHATNHALDKGKTGILNCLDFWKKNHPQIAVLGVYDSKEAQDNDIYVFEKDGIRIAILNYTYGTNGIELPADMPYLVNLIDKEKMASDIENAKEQADFVVVCPHWGTEYIHTASDAQRNWTQFFFEQGVDLVIGTHPHVIEPIEWVEDEEGHRMLVYYSIGNFINSTSGEGEGVADRMVGAEALVTVSKREDGSVYISDYGVEPLVTQMLTGEGRITTYRLADYSEELAAENEIVARDPNFSYQYCVDLCKEIFGTYVSRHFKTVHRQG